MTTTAMNDRLRMGVTRSVYAARRAAVPGEGDARGEPCPCTFPSRARAAKPSPGAPRALGLVRARRLGAAERVVDRGEHVGAAVRGALVLAQRDQVVGLERAEQDGELSGLEVLVAGGRPAELGGTIAPVGRVRLTGALGEHSVAVGALGRTAPRPPHVRAATQELLDLALVAVGRGGP